MSGPDDLRFDDDDLDAGERILAVRLASAMAVQAGTIVLADEPFDLSRPTALDLGDGEPATRPTPAGRLRGSDTSVLADPNGTDLVVLEPLPTRSVGPRARGWTVLVAGAVAAGVLIAAIVMINSVRQPSIYLDDAPLIGPDTAWVPTWVPDGFELWSLDTTFADPATILAGRSGGEQREPVLQLLESSGTDAKVLINIGPPDPAAAPRGSPITVRGAPGTSSPEQAMGSGSPMGISLEWSEGGSMFGAFVIGADAPTATALLDSLSFTVAGDPSSGFAAPADGSWTVRTDDPRSRPETDVVGGVFGYDRSRPTGERLPLQVVTVAGGSPASGFPGYLPAAFLGSMRDDGVAEAFVPASGTRPAESYTVWPDGRTVYSSGLELDAASASRIAANIEPVTREELAARADEVSAKLGAGDVVAAAALPSGRVEVIGAPGASAICLTVGSRRVCRTAESLSGAGRTLVGSVVIDGTWYVFAAGDEGSVELGVGQESASFTTTGTAIALPVEPDEIEMEASPVPTTAGGNEVVVEAVGGPGPPDIGPTSTVLAQESGPGPGPGSSDTGSGARPPDRSVPFESVVVGSWTLALLVAPADAEGAWATFPGQSMSFPRPSP